MKAEHAILKDLQRTMNSNGLKIFEVTQTINESLAKDIKSQTGLTFSVKELEGGADICIAQGWLNQSTSGANKYYRMRFTDSGLRVANVQAEKAERHKSLSNLDKLSEWVENKKGIATLTSVLISLLALATSIVALFK
ncbi:hypothetical protein RCJ22_17065 [Vibrio sp. FNV 38]|nr:hypothetical protein [Vibrio sp. FNV 38]